MTGGAAARPFNTHHHALDRHLFLRIATELYLKRAIVGGFENVYELGKFFRNEGMSPQHNPEFTMLEWFVSGADYDGVMAFAEELVAGVVERVLGTTKVERDGETIDFAAPWKRITAARRDPRGDRRRHRRARAATSWPSWPATTPSPTTTGPALVDTLQGKLIEPKLIQPTFLDRPAARHLAAGQAGARASRAARRGLRRDRRRDGDHRRRHRHQRPGSMQRRALRRTARAPGIGSEETPHRARRGVRAGARIRDADRERLRPRHRPPDDDPQPASKTLRDVILFPSMRDEARRRDRLRRRSASRPPSIGMTVPVM